MSKEITIKRRLKKSIKKRNELNQRCINAEEKIKKVIGRCKYLLENDEVKIDGKTYYKHECDDIITRFILEGLEGSDSDE